MAHSGEKVFLSSHGILHEVDVGVAFVSNKLAQYIQKFRRSHNSNLSKQVMTIDLENIPSKGLIKALEYCRCHFEQERGNFKDMVLWNQAFSRLNSQDLCEIASAAYYLELRSLLDSTSKAIAELMSDSSSAEEIRNRFKLDQVSESFDLDNNSFNLQQLNFDYSFEELSAETTLSAEQIKEHLLGSTDESVDKLVNEVADKPLNLKNKKKKKKLKKLDEDNTMTEEIQKCIIQLSGYINPSSTNTNAESDTCINTWDNSEGRNRSGNYDSRSVDDLIKMINQTSERGKKKKKKKKGRKAIKEIDKEIVKKIGIASRDPSLVFDESKFEDDEAVEEVESFRLTLQEAYKEMVDKPKILLSIPFRMSVDKTTI